MAPLSVRSVCITFMVLGTETLPGILLIKGNWSKREKLPRISKLLSKLSTLDLHNIGSTIPLYNNRHLFSKCCLKSLDEIVVLHHNPKLLSDF